MFVHDKWIPLYFFIVSSLFLLYMKKYKRLCKVIGITILFYLGQQLLMLSNVEVVQFVSLLFMMIVRLMPTYIVALILMYDYQPSEVISALQSIHVPRAFIIALSITLRYIPTFFRELRYINESMRLRGIRFEIKNIINGFLEDNGEYLFILKNNGKKVIYETFRLGFKKAMAELGMEHTIHDTRHTFASMLNQVGANDVVISNLAGHEDKEFTKRAYTHAELEDLENAIKLLQ